MQALKRFLAPVLGLAGLAVMALSAMPGAAQPPAPAPEVPAPVAAPVAAPAPVGPADVKIGMYINDIQSIDLHAYSFVADVYVWFRDTDAELVPGKSFEWMNMFAPDDHVQTDIDPEPVSQKDGSQYQVFRHQGPFAAKFSVKTYPFDAHQLTIEIEDQEWDSSRLVYSVDQVTMNPDIVLPGFIIGQPKMEIRNRPYPTTFGDTDLKEGQSYSRAVVSIPISRPVVSGITKSLLPVFIVVLVAAAALLLKPEHIEARVGLSITALLTLVALQFSAQAGLPDVGYLLMLDQIYLASYGFVLLVVGLLVMTTGNMEEEKELAAAHSIARGGALTAFLAIALYAAVIALILWLNLSSPDVPA
ncbi:MAG: hypothetical protein QM773_04505 [Hyphomonadaceae bacterium]